MINLRFKGKNKDFKIFLDNAMKELVEKEKRSSASANAQAPYSNNSTVILYTKQVI